MRVFDQKEGLFFIWKIVSIYLHLYANKKSASALPLLCVFILGTRVMIPDKTELLLTHSSAFSLITDVTELLPSSWNILEREGRCFKCVVPCGERWQPHSHCGGPVSMQ